MPTEAAPSSNKLLTVKRTNEPSRFKPGNPGGPGRPKGSRNVLSENFLAAVLVEFNKSGPDALRRMSAEDPSGFVKVIASLVPKEIGIGGADGQPLQIVVRRMDDHPVIDAV